jgi:hypothetical protein
LAVKLERQFMQELSLGKNSAAGTTLRKLQSALRNNVNTSYGNRLNMLDELDPDLITEIGGQALSSITPRGLQGLTAGTVGAYGAFINPTTLAALPLQSPRLVGELAFKLGQLEKGLTPLQGQTALNVARGTRLVGEITRADDIDNAELLKILLKNTNIGKDVDTININTIRKGAAKLEDEFEDKEKVKTFAEGGSVTNNQENIADTILQKLSTMFTDADLNSSDIKNELTSLQRISKDAQSNKYKDQVFKELQTYGKRLLTKIKQTKSVPLQRIKNVVDLAINNKIDDGFKTDNQDLQDQLQYAPDLYAEYIGLESSDEPFEAREKTANKILEKVTNKKFNPVQTVNFLTSHNKFAPKDSVPLFINKLAETLTEKQFENAENSLKDAMLIKLFGSKKQNLSGSGAYDVVIQENQGILDSLFTNEEQADLEFFKQNVAPEINKNLAVKPEQSKYMFISGLAETGLLGEKKLSPATNSVDVAKDSLKKLQKPLMPTPQNIEPERQMIITQQTEQVTEPKIDLENLSSDLDAFVLPRADQDLFTEESIELSDAELTSPAILPNEKDREIAMRQMGGIQSLV